MEDHLSHRGFTLLEVMLVMALMSLMVGISAVFLARGLPSARLAATGREMAAAVRQARAHAQIEGAGQAVTLDLDGRTYGVEGRAQRTIPGDIGIMVLDPVAGEVTRGTYSILCDPAGTVEGGTIVLWNKSKRLRVEMDPIVGSVVTKE
jgi:general secretion pathway protein H